MKAAARNLKDKERKFGSLENKLKDLEDEQLIVLEQHQDQLKSKQAMFQHQLDDSKRRNLELEEKLSQNKKLIEDLRLAAEKPTHDTAKEGKNENNSEEVLQLHEQMTEMHTQMTAMENQNMETVALLKQENRKMMKQLKSTETDKAVSSSVAPSKVSQREVAALTVQHEMLEAKVAELKRFLQEHPQSGSTKNEQNINSRANDEEMDEMENEL